MKRRVLVCLCAALCLALCSCSSYNDPYIPIGYYDSEEHYEDAFQDFTDYCKYYYPDNYQFKNADAYREVTQGDIELIKAYVSDWEGWYDIHDFDYAFDFDANSQIKTGDYFFIKIEAENYSQRFWNYDIYYFDNSNNTLYFMHNNI